jgi:hypothetical protein
MKIYQSNISIVLSAYTGPRNTGFFYITERSRILILIYIVVLESLVSVESSIL